MPGFNGNSVSSTPKERDFSAKRPPSNTDDINRLVRLLTGVLLDFDHDSDWMRKEARSAAARQVLYGIKLYKGLRIHVCPPPPRLGISETDLHEEVSQALLKCGIQETIDAATEALGPVLVLRLEAKRQGRITVYQINLDVRQTGVFLMGGAQKILASSSLWRADTFNIAGTRETDRVWTDIRGILRQFTRDIQGARKALSRSQSKSKIGDSRVCSAL